MSKLMMRLSLPLVAAIVNLQACSAPTYPGPLERDHQPSIPLDAGAPWALTTEVRGIVISPHAPNSSVDVRGIARGRIVKDPVSGLLFRVP